MYKHQIMEVYQTCLIHLSIRCRWVLSLFPPLCIWQDDG